MVWALVGDNHVSYMRGGEILEMFTGSLKRMSTEQLLNFWDGLNVELRPLVNIHQFDEVKSDACVVKIPYAAVYITCGVNSNNITEPKETDFVSSDEESSEYDDSEETTSRLGKPKRRTFRLLNTEVPSEINEKSPRHQDATDSNGKRKTSDSSTREQYQLRPIPTPTPLNCSNGFEKNISSAQFPPPRL